MAARPASWKWIGAMSAAAMLAACGSQPETATNDLQAFLPTVQGVDPATGALPPLPRALPLAAQPVGDYRSAPAAAALPAARNLGWADAGDDGYAWLDRADTLFDTIGDSPPDYGFGYDGVEPWGWDIAGGHSVFAEPIDDGFRYYYYEPQAHTPFMVRDPWRSYGFAEDRLVGVFDNGGAILPLAAAGAFLPVASRYFSRGRDLRNVAYAHPRRSVAAPRWAARQPYMTQARRQWAAARDRQPQWQSFRARQGVRADRPQVRYERQARRQAAQQFATWQREDFRGQAPRLYDRARAERRDDRRRARQQQARRTQSQVERRSDRQQQQAAERRGDQRQARVAQQRAVRQQQGALRRGEQRQARATQQRAARQQQAASRRGEQRQARAAQQRAARQQQAAARRGEQRQARATQQRAARQQQAVTRRGEQRQARATQQRAARQQRAAAHRTEQRQARAQQRRPARQQQAVARRAERQQARAQQPQRQQVARAERGGGGRQRDR